MLDPGSGSATLSVKKVQKDEQRRHLLGCKYNQFCVSSLCCELCWIISQTGLFPQPQLDRVLEWLNAKTKGGLPTLLKNFSAGCAKKFGRKRRVSKCITKHMNRHIKKIRIKNSVYVIVNDHLYLKMRPLLFYFRKKNLKIRAQFFPVARFFGRLLLRYAAEKSATLEPDARTASLQLP